MDDTYYINKANELLENGVYTKHSLSKALNISRHRLSKLENKIKNMPRTLTRSQAASLGVKTGRINWGKRFLLPGSPKGGKK